MATFTLDDIAEAADKAYGSMDIPLSNGNIVSLRNALRLSKAERKELQALQAQLGEDADKSKDGDEESAVPNDIDEAKIFEDSLVLVASNKADGKQLVKDLDHDLGKLITVFKLYNKDTELGEASASQD
jgi:hypothetical protein